MLGAVAQDFKEEERDSDEDKKARLVNECLLWCAKPTGHRAESGQTDFLRCLPVCAGSADGLKSSTLSAPFLDQVLYLHFFRSKVKFPSRVLLGFDCF